MRTDWSTSSKLATIHQMIYRSKVKTRKRARILDLSLDIEKAGQAQHNTRGLTLGGIFSRHKKAPEKPAQEDMSHLPPEQQKRALKKMRKDVEKELDKTRAELKALEKMQNLAKSSSKMGDPSDYTTKIAEVNTRIQQHDRKINQINNWLGEKPSSKAPSEPGSSYEAISANSIFKNPALATVHRQPPFPCRVPPMPPSRVMIEFTMPSHRGDWHQIGRIHLTR